MGIPRTIWSTSLRVAFFLHLHERYLKTCSLKDVLKSLLQRKRHLKLTSASSSSLSPIVSTKLPSNTFNQKQLQQPSILHQTDILAVDVLLLTPDTLPIPFNRYWVIISVTRWVDYLFKIWTITHKNISFPNRMKITRALVTAKCPLANCM